MEQLRKKVSDLHFAGAYGGEEGRYRATQFFVAEAKLWAEGGASPRLIRRSMAEE
jgi:hypothetical protein